MFDKARSRPGSFCQESPKLWICIVMCALAEQINSLWDGNTLKLQIQKCAISKGCISYKRDI